MANKITEDDVNKALADNPVSPDIKWRFQDLVTKDRANIILEYLKSEGATDMDEQRFEEFIHRCRRTIYKKTCQNGALPWIGRPLVEWFCYRRILCFYSYQEDHLADVLGLQAPTPDEGPLDAAFCVYRRDYLEVVRSMSTSRAIEALTQQPATRHGPTPELPAIEPLTSTKKKRVASPPDIEHSQLPETKRRCFTSAELNIELKEREFQLFLYASKQLLDLFKKGCLSQTLFERLSVLPDGTIELQYPLHPDTGNDTREATTAQTQASVPYQEGSDRLEQTASSERASKPPPSATQPTMPVLSPLQPASAAQFPPSTPTPTIEVRLPAPAFQVSPVDQLPPRAMTTPAPTSQPQQVTNEELEKVIKALERRPDNWHLVWLTARERLLAFSAEELKAPQGGTDLQAVQTIIRDAKARHLDDMENFLLMIQPWDDETSPAQWSDFQLQRRPMPCFFPLFGIGRKLPGASDGTWVLGLRYNEKGTIDELGKLEGGEQAASALHSVFLPFWPLPESQLKPLAVGAINGLRGLLHYLEGSGDLVVDVETVFGDFGIPLLNMKFPEKEERIKKLYRAVKSDMGQQ